MLLLIVVREYAAVPQLCRIPQQGGRIHESPRKFGHAWNQTSHEHFSSVRKRFRTERNELWLGAFVAGMAVSTLAASWVFAAQKLGGESYQCTSYPIHKLPYRSEVSPFLAEFFSDLVQSYCSYCSSYGLLAKL